MPDTAPDDTPAAVGDALGAAGACPAIDFNGKAYRLGHPTQQAKARFEQAVVDAELSNFRTQLARGFVTQAEYDEKIDRLGGQCDRREHAVGGPLWLKYTVGREVMAGWQLHVWSLFAENHGDITPADVRAMMADDPAALRLLVRRTVPPFFEWVGGALKLPPEKVAALLAQVMAALDPPTPTNSTP